MSRLVKAGIAAAAVVALALSFMAKRQPLKPLDQQVLAADGIEFLGQDFPADGGSRGFFFRLPHGQPMVLLVRHRDARKGGNPEFQEIWLDRIGGFETYVDVRPSSPLETKLVTLLQVATVRPNTRFSEPPNAPNAEQLKWVVDRIQDRKSKW